jgi:hypothetical protein
MGDIVSISASEETSTYCTLARGIMEELVSSNCHRPLYPYTIPYKLPHVVLDSEHLPSPYSQVKKRDEM